LGVHQVDAALVPARLATRGVLRANLSDTAVWIVRVGATAGGQRLLIDGAHVVGATRARNDSLIAARSCDGHGLEELTTLRVTQVVARRWADARETLQVNGRSRPRKRAQCVVGGAFVGYFGFDIHAVAPGLVVLAFLHTFEAADEIGLLFECDAALTLCTWNTRAERSLRALLERVAQL